MIDRQHRTTDDLIARSRTWRAAHMPHTIAQPEPEPSDLCLIALGLAEAGYHVHPLAPRDKMPVSGGNGYKDATRDAETIKRMWAKYPDANVGINLALSGIVDIAPDCAEWAATFKANGMERTILYVSGGGGGHWHSWYRLPKDGPIARACVSGQYDVMSEGNSVAPGSIHPSGKAYHLHTKLIPVNDLPFAPAWAIDMLLSRPSVDKKEHTSRDWADMIDGARLITGRFRALDKANEQLRAVVSGEGVSIAGDNSVSMQRAVFVNQLLRAKYPHDEIRALALHFQGVLESDPDTFEADIDRLLCKYTPNGYTPEPTRGIDRYEEPPRGGRHYEITTAEMIDRYRCSAVNGIVDWTQSDSASECRVSIGTIKRREADAVAAGLMRRVVTDDRQRSYVVLPVETADGRSQCIAMPNKENDDNGRSATCPGSDDDTRTDGTQDGNGRTDYQATGEGTAQTGAGGAHTGRENNHSVRRAEPGRCAEAAERQVHGPGTARTAESIDVRSQPVLPQQEAVNAPAIAVCNERAHVEITHSPGLDTPTPNRDLLAFVRELAGAADEPGWFQRDYIEWTDRALQAEAARLGALLDATDEGEALHADIAAEYWKRTTADGRRFARIEARQARDLAGVQRLAHVLRGPPMEMGKCVPSICPNVQQALQL